MAPRKKIKSQSAKEADHTLSVAKPDWSLLPPELLHLISECLGDSFDAAIHARSVCKPWRSAFTYPSSVLSRTTYSLPSFHKFPHKSRGFCTLLNFPVFLFISRAPNASHTEFFLGGIVREDNAELPSSSNVQCTVKVKMPWSDPTSISICDYQIVPLGRQYKMVGYDLNLRYRAVARLPLTKKGGGGGFVVLLGYSDYLLALKSTEMRWKRLKHRSMAWCQDIVTFRGRFYAVLFIGKLFVIDPYSLKLTPLKAPPLVENCGIDRYLVPSGDDELYLVEQIIPRGSRVIRIGLDPTRVSRLDEETGEWVVVSDLGDRVLLIGPPGNRTCSGKDLPDGCGLTGNSILQTTNMGGGVTHAYKYGVDTRHEEDYLDLNYWRSTQQHCVTVVSASPNPVRMKSPVVSLRVERKP